MTKYYLGSDKSGDGDEECLQEIQTTLESAGHTVEYLGIDSNLEGSITSRIKSGEVGLFGVNGLCIGTMISTNDDLPDGTTCVFFAMKSHTDFCEEPDFSSKKIDMAHDDNFSSSETRSKYGGNKYTPKEVVDKLDKISFVTWQGSCKAQAESIMNGSVGSNNNTSEESSTMSGWDSLCDLLKPLDGLAMMLQRGDTVIVKRITVPEENMGDASNITREVIDENASDEEEKVTFESSQTLTTKTDIDNQTVEEDLQLYAYEGINIVEDSVTVTEYNPEIYNTLEIWWGGESYPYSFTLTFNKHKELFGERKLSLEAKNKVTVVVNGDDETNDDKDKNEEDK